MSHTFEHTGYQQLHGCMHNVLTTKTAWPLLPCCWGYSLGLFFLLLLKPSFSVLHGIITQGLIDSYDILSQGLNLEAAAQGMAGTQRAFFNLLAARGGATRQVF